MGRDNQPPRELEEKEQQEQAGRIKHTKLLNDIIAETKKSILEKIDFDEKNTPYEERFDSWTKRISEAAYPIINKISEIPITERPTWFDEIKSKINDTEKEFLLDNRRSVKEGHEPTVDSGMFYQKLR